MLECFDVRARLLVLGQVEAVFDQFDGDSADIDVFVVDEERFSFRAVGAAFLRRLVQNPIEECVAETQPVFSQIVGEELRYVQVHRLAVFGLHVLEYHLLAISDDHLHDHALDFICLIFFCIKFDYVIRLSSMLFLYLLLFCLCQFLFFLTNILV